MGADGGVAWMALKNSSKYDRVRELVYPFWNFTESGCADWQEDANYAWLDENGEYSGPEYLVGRYGSFQDIDLTDLRDILLSDDGEVCSDPSLTFLELLEDLDTRPLLFNNGSKWEYLSPRSPGVFAMRYCYDSRGGRLSTLEIVLWEHLRYSSSTEDRKEKLGCLAEMKVSDWLEELNELLDGHSTSSEETWT